MRRRDYIAVFGFGSVAALTGCLDSDTDDSTDSQTDNGTTDTADANGGEDSRPPGEELGNEPLAIGEGVIFYTEDGTEELSFRPSMATYTNVLVTDRQQQGLVATEFPERERYLLVPVEVENFSQQAVNVPSEISLSVAGSEYDHTLTAFDSQYEEFQELEAGEFDIQFLVFDMPASEETATLSAEWGRMDRVAAEWELPVQEAEYDEFEYEGLGVGEQFIIGTSEVEYAFVVETVDYEPSESKTSVSVTLQVENTGSIAGLDPTIRGVSLVADGEVHDASAADGVLDAEELEPGDSETVTLSFELAGDPEEFQFQIQVTQELTATWDI